MILFLPEEKEKMEELEQKWDKSILEILEIQGRTLSTNIETEKATRLLEELTEQNLENKKGRNQFVILSAPTASGKTTVGEILENFGFVKLPRITTRKKRVIEQDGKDYFFISKEEFDKRADNGEFFPFVQTYGDLRATSRKMFSEYIKSKKKFYVEGSAKAYNKFTNDPEIKNFRFLSIFILPPSFEELKRRLVSLNRPSQNKLSNEEIIERLQNAVEHLEQTKDFDYDAYLVNDSAERIAEKIKKYF